MSQTTRLGKRLRRILMLIPYAIRHPGVSIDELSDVFSASTSDILKDLDLIFVCGLPGYGPGDLIDVWIEDDRVYVQMADYFSAPLRLTPSEGLALYATGTALLQLPGMERADALRSALQKVGEVLGNAGSDPGLSVRLEPGAPEHVEALEQALERGVQVRLEYLSASRAALTHRTIHPWGMVAALGHLYVVGFDEASGEERMFRTDRMKSVTVLDDPATPAKDFDPERYRGAFAGGGGSRVRLQISPSVAAWFGDYYPVLSSEVLDDGWTAVELESGGDRWAATLVLRLGADVGAVEPPAVRDEARKVAAAIEARYREVTPSAS